MWKSATMQERGKGWLPSGGGLAGFLAGTTFAIFPGTLLFSWSAMAGGLAPLLAALAFLSISLAVGFSVKKVVNRVVHGER